MASNETNIVFTGARSAYSHPETQPNGQVKYVNYYMRQEMRLKLVPSGNNIVITAGAKILENQFGFIRGAWLDGQLVWRYKGDSAWNVIDTFNSSAGYAGFAFSSGSVDSEGYSQLRTNGAEWSKTISVTGGRALEIGYRPHPNSPGGWLRFTVVFTDYGGFGYAYSKSADPVYEEASVGPSGGIVYMDIGGTFQSCSVWIDTGSEWIQAQPYVDNGTEWLPCG